MRLWPLDAQTTWREKEKWQWTQRKMTGKRWDDHRMRCVRLSKSWNPGLETEVLKPRSWGPAGCPGLIPGFFFFFFFPPFSGWPKVAVPTSLIYKFTKSVRPWVIGRSACIFYGRTSLCFFCGRTGPAGRTMSRTRVHADLSISQSVYAFCFWLCTVGPTKPG